MSAMSVVDKQINGVDQIAKRVATAKTSEELLVLLANVSRQFNHENQLLHDEDMMDGAATGLIKSLHNSLLLRDGTKQKYYRLSLSHSQALQVTVLCTAVEMMLRCSSEVIAENIAALETELIPSLPKILELFTAWDGGDIIRLFTLSNAIKIVRRVSLHSPGSTKILVDGLLLVLRGAVTSDVHVDAASAIAKILDEQHLPGKRKWIIDRIIKDTSLIISTLSTAALATPHEDSEEVLTGLFNFAVHSHTIRAKMSKRRCTILAISKHLTSETVENRKIALNICKCLLNDPVHTSHEVTPLESNNELLLNKVIHVAKSESESLLQLYAINLLGDAIIKTNLPSSLVESILSALREITIRDGQDGPIMEAAIVFMKASMSLPGDIPVGTLAAIADFTTLPFARARSIALCTIDVLSQNTHVAPVLLRETEILENFSLIIVHGSEEDRVDAMNVLRVLSANSSHHHALCQSRSLLSALVHFVIKDNAGTHAAHLNGILTILALMSNDDNIRSFMPYVDLLPWLVRQANMTSDEELKKKLVSSIVRLSSAILG